MWPTLHASGWPAVLVASLGIGSFQCSWESAAWQQPLNLRGSSLCLGGVLQTCRELMARQAQGLTDVPGMAHPAQECKVVCVCRLKQSTSRNAHPKCDAHTCNNGCLCEEQRIRMNPPICGNRSSPSAYVDPNQSSGLMPYV